MDIGPRPHPASDLVRVTPLLTAYDMLATPTRRTADPRRDCLADLPVLRFQNGRGPVTHPYEVAFRSHGC